MLQPLIAFGLRRSHFVTHSLTARRWTGTIGADEDEVADLLDRTVVKGAKFTDRPAVLTTRREALSLYREILRWSNLFVWRDANGRMYREVIRESARKEFEDARFERDPEIVTRLLVTGRDCVQKTVERVMQQRQRLMQQQGGGAPGASAGSSVPQ